MRYSADKLYCGYGYAYRFGGECGYGRGFTEYFVCEGYRYGDGGYQYGMDCTPSMLITGVTLEEVALNAILRE